MIIGEFCDVFPPELDGVGTVVRNYVEQFNKKGNDCYYIAPKADKLSNDEIVSSTLNVINHLSIPLPHEAYRLGLPLLDTGYLRDVNKIKFDIVHAHSPFASGLEALRVSKSKGLPLVGTFHSKYYDDFYSKTHNKLLAALGTDYVVSFFNRCDEVWTVSDSTVETLRSYGYQGEIFVVPNGTNLWYPTEADRKTAELKYSLGEENVFLFVGQHNFKKNTKHIIEAIAVYAKTHSDFKMVFVGQGPDAEKMKEMTVDLGIADRTVFVGQLMDRTELMRIYARADLFIFPSLYDNASLVIREAAAAGTPSIVIKGSCIASNITDNENGFLCEDSPESIAACMERALPELKRVGENARNTLPVPWSDITDMAMARYIELIEKSKRRK